MTTCQWCGQGRAELRARRSYELGYDFTILLGKKNDFKICRSCIPGISKAWIDRRHSISIRNLTSRELKP